MGFASEKLQLCYDLLGFQQGCLSAPQEVSTWTKFCEVDIHSPLVQLMREDIPAIHLPEDISRFESHLQQPVRMHNIREKMQKSGLMENIVIENTSEKVEEDGVRVDPINVYAKTQHVFAEVGCFFTMLSHLTSISLLQGPEMLISDVMIFPIIFLIDQRAGIVSKYPYIR